MIELRGKMRNIRLSGKLNLSPLSAVRVLLQDKTATPTTYDLVIEADKGYDGLEKVTVVGEPNFIEKNIVNGKTMWGKVGTGVAAPFASTAVGILPPIYKGTAPSLRNGPNSECFAYGLIFEAVTNTYLFNGQELPEIPQAVLAVYPYVWIRKNTAVGQHEAIFSRYGFYYTGTHIQDKNSEMSPKYACAFDGGESWTIDSESHRYGAWLLNENLTCMWSNHDIVSGSADSDVIYLEASEPVLVD